MFYRCACDANFFFHYLLKLDRTSVTSAVVSVHPWANSKWPTGQSESALYSSYVTIIIGWGFCDIQNNQGRGKSYQPKPKAEADNPYRDLNDSKRNIAKVNIHLQTWTLFCFFTDGKPHKARSLRLRLITLYETLIILNITKTDLIIFLLYIERKEKNVATVNIHSQTWTLFCFFTDGKPHKARELGNHAPRSYMTWLPVTLTWLLYNLQVWRHKRWFPKLTVRFRPIRKEIASSMYNNNCYLRNGFKHWPFNEILHRVFSFIYTFAERVEVRADRIFYWKTCCRL